MLYSSRKSQYQGAQESSVKLLRSSCNTNRTPYGLVENVLNATHIRNSAATVEVRGPGTYLARTLAGNSCGQWRVVRVVVMFTGLNMILASSENLHDFLARTVVVLAPEIVASAVPALSFLLCSIPEVTRYSKQTRQHMLCICVLCKACAGRELVSGRTNSAYSWQRRATMNVDYLTKHPWYQTEYARICLFLLGTVPEETV